MVENILILGNGFDLAMGRQTSYEDFLRFLNSLSFLLYCQKAYNQQIDVNNYDFLLKEFDDILGDSESDSEEDFQNELEFYNSSSDTVKSDKVKLGILLDCLSNYFNDKKIRLIPFFEKNRNFKAYSESEGGNFRRDLLSNLKSIREEKGDIESKYFLDVDVIDDLIQMAGTKNYEWLLKIRSNLFFDFINEFKDKLGEKWSSIELIISDIAEAIAYVKKHLEENSQIIEWKSTDELTKLKKKFITKSNYIAFKVVIARLSGYRFIYTDSGWQQIVDVCNEECIQALNDLTDYLEFYLTYLDKLDFEERKIEKRRSNLDVIEGLEKAKVLTFNYTDTANRLFGIPEENTHFIHGRIDFARKQKSINTMVFGIEDKEDKEDKTENINPDLISYQKFYQRIIKETGSDYRKFFENPKDSGKSVDDMNIVVFGHSVDPLDKEIFKKCFKLAEERGGKYKFIFNYYDEKAKREIVKNLTIILGKERMISLTAEQKVAFVKCDDVQRMKRELL
nr:AbiH family protein [Streptococcus lutetiensis]